MGAVSEHRDIPTGSVILVNEPRSADYLDRYVFSLAVSGVVSTDYLAKEVFTIGPSWARWLLRLRDAIVGVFGLRTAEWPEVSTAKEVRFEPGEKAVLFTVSHRTESEIVMAEGDRHLDFRVSVHQSRASNDELHLAVTTAVWFNNVWGKLYFMVIRPFHCLILKSMMRRARVRLARELGATPSLGSVAGEMPATLRRGVASGLAVVGSLAVAWMGLSHFPMAYATARSGEFARLSGSANDFLILLCLCVGLLLLFVGLLSLYFSLRIWRGDPLARGYCMSLGLLFLARTGLELLHPVTIFQATPSVLVAVAALSLTFFVPALLARSAR